MLKTLALVLLVTVAACKTDDAPATAPGGGGAGEVTASPSGGPPARSGKIDLPPRAPSLPGAVAEGKSATPAPDDGARGDRGERRRQMTDTDGDGNISEEEREAMSQQRQQRMIERLDADGDGKVSEEERGAARRERTEGMRARLDANGDGKVTADELAGARRARPFDMKSTDTDGDGRHLGRGARERDARPPRAGPRPPLGRARRDGARRHAGAAGPGPVRAVRAQGAAERRPRASRNERARPDPRSVADPGGLWLVQAPASPPARRSTGVRHPWVTGSAGIYTVRPARRGIRCGTPAPGPACA